MYDGNGTRAVASFLCVHGASLPFDVSWYKNGHSTQGTLAITLEPSATIVISGATSALANVKYAIAEANAAIRDFMFAGANSKAGK